MFHQISTALLLSSLFHQSAAFSVSTANHGRLQKRSSAVMPLNVATPLNFYDSEESAFAMMEKARECAFSDSCSLEEAEGYLNGVLHVQSGCASGTLVGHDVCENQDVAAEIVANLRAKIEQSSSSKLRVLNNASQVAGLSLAALLVSMVALSSISIQPDATPFTIQEWWWAAKGGYLNTMFEHYMRNGGLSVVDYQPDATPLTVQEWWWALTGGYLDTMIVHSFKNGGLLTSTDYQADFMPFTSEEWMWAAKGGYLNQMVEQFVQNGGL